MRVLGSNTTIISLCLLVGLMNCDNGDQQVDERQKLPPITSTGKLTFGCLVNGKAKVAKRTLDITAYHQLGMLQVTGVVDDGLMVIYLYMDDSSIKPVPFTVSFDDVLHSQAGVSYANGTVSCRGQTEGTAGSTGSVTITRFDHINFIISGTFNFSVKMSGGCEAYSVTEGRFDTRFNP